MSYLKLKPFYLMLYNIKKEKNQYKDVYLKGNGMHYAQVNDELLGIKEVKDYFSSVYIYTDINKMEELYERFSSLKYVYIYVKESVLVLKFDKRKKQVYSNVKVYEYDISSYGEKYIRQLEETNKQKIDKKEIYEKCLEQKNKSRF